MIIHPPGSDWQLAEVNIAKLKAPIYDPSVAGFANALDKVNAIAERMDGFVWRHIDDDGSTETTSVMDNELIIYNASTWESVEDLERFVWNTIHAQFFKRRAEWFDTFGSMHFAMWWVPAGTTFSSDEALERLAALEKDGPSELAFGWEQIQTAKV